MIFIKTELELVEFSFHLVIVLQADMQLQLSEEFRGNTFTPHITQIHPSPHPTP